MDPPSRQLGHTTLGILAEDWSVPILRELLDGGPLRPSQLEERLPAAPHSVVMRRLAAMASIGVVDHERHRGLPPKAQYALGRRGRRILNVVDTAARWERTWICSPEDGGLALRLIGDERTREIILLLATGPASIDTLHDQLRGPIARSTARHHLAALVNHGLLQRKGAGTYELTDSARDLALVEIAAARWEWESAKPRPQVYASDIASVLRLFAPSAHLPGELAGICHVQIDAPAAGADVYMAATGHRVAPLSVKPPGLPRAACHATTQAWCDALLLGRWRHVVISHGDRALMAAILASLASTLTS